MTRAHTPIGVFDSGLGGLTVLAALRRAMPEQDFLFLGDNANAPYGVREPDEVIALTRAAMERLFAQGCNLVLIACNTASALALRKLQQEWLPEVAPEKRILGVFVPLIEALTGREWADTAALSGKVDAGFPSESATNKNSNTPREGDPRHAVFFATPATVRSGAFTREARRLSPGLSIVEQACPGLVDAIEAGQAMEPSVEAAVAEALAHGKPDAALLGCTHYPHAEAVFRAALPPGTPILSQPQIVAESLSRYLERHPQFRSGTGWLDCITTGDPKHVSARAEALFGRALPFDGV